MNDIFSREATRISPRAPGPEQDHETITAFCATCPEQDTLTALLQGLGLRLVFSLAADDAAVMADLPPLPAQYHYEDEVGTRVEYLAGEDLPCLADDEDDPQEMTRYRYPPHASRFWLTPGGQELVTRRVREALATAFHLRWQVMADVQTRRGAA
jgi:hypothetical protein